MSGLNANHEVALQNPDDGDEIAEAARRLIELGKLLSDKSRTLREALTELTTAPPGDAKRKDRARLWSK